MPSQIGSLRSIRGSPQAAHKPPLRRLPPSQEHKPTHESVHNDKVMTEHLMRAKALFGYLSPLLFVSDSHHGHWWWMQTCGCGSGRFVRTTWHTYLVVMTWLWPPLASRWLFISLRLVPLTPTCGSSSYSSRAGKLDS